MGFLKGLGSKITGHAAKTQAKTIHKSASKACQVHQLQMLKPGCGWNCGLRDLHPQPVNSLEVEPFGGNALTLESP